MKVSDVARVRPGEVDVDVSVSPRSNRSGPDGFDEWRRRLIIRVKAPPLDGRANKEVAALFQEITGCKADVTSGQTSRQKTVTIFGDGDAIIRDLEARIDG